MKNKRTKKQKIIMTVCVLLVGLLAAICVVGYSIGRNFYDASNYTADEDAMNNLTAGSDEEEISEEEATGEKLTEEEEAELAAQREAFINSEEIAQSDDVYNVLLVGVDRRDRSWAGNSDSMILLSVNSSKKQISMISLMRDTYVDIPGIGMRKLNAAHANGAGPLLIETVTENYRIQVDRYASVDFLSMIEIVDAVGGVELDMSDEEVRVANGYIYDMCNINNLNYDKYKITSSGTHEYNGMQAVGFARIRYVGHADYERTARQREVLTQILEKIKDMSMTEIYNFVEEVLPLVTHNIPEDEMWDMVKQAPSLLTYDLVQDRIPYDDMYKVIYVKKQDMLVPDWEDTIRKLKDTLY